MKYSSKKSPKPCSSCGSNESFIFYEALAVPSSCNLLWRSKEEAVNCPKGDIHLSYCPSCGFVENISVDPRKNQYTILYDNSLGYSQVFQDFAKKLVMETIQRFDLKNKTVLEVTVGKVDFLSLFCDLGQNTGVKLNTSFVNAAPNQMSDHTDDNTQISHDNPSGQSEEKIDFVFCYSELEHVNSPKHFLSVLRRNVNLNHNAIFFFSVPNALRDFEEGNYLDIIYEHVSYFTFPSILYLFNSCGYRVLDIAETKDFLNSIEVTASANNCLKSPLKANMPLELINIRKSVLSFGSKSHKLIRKSCKQIKQLLNHGKKIVVWGAGARGVTFLNILRDSRIEYAIDINPKKQGKYVPGTGQEIVDPQFLLKYQPDSIILLNPAYQNEVKQTIQNLGIKTTFIQF